MFPSPKHPDYLPDELAALKGKYDLCSRLMHSGVSGMAGHFKTTPDSFRLIFFDLPPDKSLFSTFMVLLETHKDMLSLFGRILEPHTNARLAAWKVRLNSVEAKFMVHAQRWAPMYEQEIAMLREAGSRTPDIAKNR